MAKHDNWTDQQLTDFRKQGDPEADDLAAAVLKDGTPGGGRLGYNLILDLADVLTNQPALAMVEESNVNLLLREFDEELRRYYEPTKAPAWVDPAKLRIGQEIWERYPLPVIGVLYAASLPSCYLIKRGIPALYDTEKLREHKYVFQRIYETGIMLEGVMAPGGIQILDDVTPTHEELLVAALEALDPDGKWIAQGPRIVRTAGPAAPDQGPTKEEIEAKVEALQAERGKERFIWGPGYIAARKVRMLHASMRFMLQHKDLFSGAGVEGTPHTLSERIRADADAGKPSWPTEDLGVPVNQEDLAYTLLTFGYAIPVGLNHWGAGLTRREREGFLHLWKVVGHIMGLREELLTDDWDEAGLLYRRIQRLECGRSESGVALTKAVMEFLESYLPKTFGLNKLVGASLIRDQMGPQLAAELLPEPDLKRASSLAGRLMALGFRTFARCYFFLYRELARRMPLVSRLMENVFERSADELVNSWRDAYTRKPFYVPNEYNQWVRLRGADEAFLTKLQRWRERVFLGVVGPLLTFFVALLSGVLWIGFWATHHAWTATAGWTALGAFLVTVLLSEAYLPHVYRSRPTLESEKGGSGAVDLS